MDFLLLNLVVNPCTTLFFQFPGETIEESWNAQNRIVYYNCPVILYDEKAIARGITKYWPTREETLYKLKPHPIYPTVIFTDGWITGIYTVPLLISMHQIKDVPISIILLSFKDRVTDSLPFTLRQVALLSLMSPLTSFFFIEMNGKLYYICFHCLGRIEKVEVDLRFRNYLYGERFSFKRVLIEVQNYGNSDKWARSKLVNFPGACLTITSISSYNLCMLRHNSCLSWGAPLIANLLNNTFVNCGKSHTFSRVSSETSVEKFLLNSMLKINHFGTRNLLNSARYMFLDFTGSVKYFIIPYSREREGFSYPLAGLDKNCKRLDVNHLDVHVFDN